MTIAKNQNLSREDPDRDKSGGEVVGDFAARLQEEDLKLIYIYLEILLQFYAHSLVMGDLGEKVQPLQAEILGNCWIYPYLNVLPFELVCRSLEPPLKFHCH